MFRGKAACPKPTGPQDYRGGSFERHKWTWDNLKLLIHGNHCQPLKLFVIHRFKEKQQAKRMLKRLARDLSIEIHPVFLNSSGDVEWKQKATEAIRTSEAVIVFNPESCEESFNAKWEVERAKEAGKKLFR